MNELSVLMPYEWDQIPTLSSPQQLQVFGMMATGHWLLGSQVNPEMTQGQLWLEKEHILAPWASLIVKSGDWKPDCQSKHTGSTAGCEWQCTCKKIFMELVNAFWGLGRYE